MPSMNVPGTCGRNVPGHRPALRAYGRAATTAGLLLLCLSTVGLSQDAYDPEYLGDLGPQGPAQNREVYGYGTSDTEAPIRVGDVGTWRFSYHVGAVGVDDGGRIWLQTNIVSDWHLQTDQPSAPNYVTAETDGKVRLSLRTDRRHAGPRPYWGGVEITVRDGSLAPGDIVTVTIGDRSAGSIGAHAPSIAPSSVAEMRFAVDPLNSNNPVRVAGSPLAPVEPGPATRIEAVWPSEARAGEPTWLLVKAKDRGGNAAQSYRGRVRINVDARLDGLPREYRFTAEDEGFHRFEIRHRAQAGTFRVDVADVDNAALATSSNLQTITAADGLGLYCGDLHGQHNRGSATAEQYAMYARNFGGADFMSWAVNDFHLTQANWKNINRVSAKLDEPGRFVVFPGYEWSATTSRGGDHNVIYIEEGMPLYRSGYVEHDLRGYDPATDRYTVPSLLASLDREKTIVIPHIGGRRADLDAFDPDFMYFIEMYSSHGQFEWFLEEAIQRELPVGFMASSDDAFGKLGDSPPGASGLFAVHGGLTCTFAERLDRPSLWKAFRQHRVYGTTGERIQLRFRAGSHWLGEDVKSPEPVTFSVESSGAAPIERIEIFRNLEAVHVVDGAAESRNDRLRVVWRGAASRERARQSLWSGELSVSRGNILSITPYRLDQASETAVQTDRRTIDLETVTSGDADGVVLELDEEAVRGAIRLQARLRSRNQFGSLGDDGRVIDIELPIADLPASGFVRELGGLDQAIEISPLGSGYPDSISFEWRESARPAGRSAYWVRVTQTDGATAWSSPIYVLR